MSRYLVHLDLIRHYYAKIYYGKKTTCVMLYCLCRALSCFFSFDQSKNTYEVDGVISICEISNKSDKLEVLTLWD